MKLIILLLIVLSLNVQASLKDKTFGTLVVSEVTSIYDGDTFRVNIKGMHPLVGDNIGIRVAGLDTPELRGKCPKEKALAREAKQVTVDFLRKSKHIELRGTKRGKYFRIVADVYGDNVSLKEILLDKNLAVPYNGKTKYKDWCK